jgi:uncharacterized membrane protein YhaH (DUF805 family)
MPATRSEILRADSFDHSQKDKSQMDSNNPYQTPTKSNVTAPPLAKPTLATILFSFQGRIPLHIFWCIFIASWIGLFFVAICFLAVFVELADAPSLNVMLLVLYLPATLITLAAQVKRWHDRDKSGCWVLIQLIPFVGAFWSFIELGCLPGTFGPNRYGPDPIADLKRTAAIADEAAVPAVVQARVEETCPWCEASVIPDDESRCPACQRPI